MWFAMVPVVDLEYDGERNGAEWVGGVRVEVRE